MKVDAEWPEAKDVSNVHTEKWMPQADLLGMYLLRLLSLTAG